MTLEELKPLELLALSQIEAGKKYLLVIDYGVLPEATIRKLQTGFGEYFGAGLSVVRKSPSGELKLFEIKP